MIMDCNEGRDDPVRDLIDAVKQVYLGLPVP